MAHLSEDQLRSLVRQFIGCLSVLTLEGRDVLVMRAGLYGPPESSTAVAHKLHIGARRERLIEAIAILELKWASAHSACSGGGMSLFTVGAPGQYASLLSSFVGTGQPGQAAAGGMGGNAHSTHGVPGFGSSLHGVPFPNAAIGSLPHSMDASEVLLVLGALVLLATLGFAAAHRQSAERRRVAWALADVIDAERSDFYRRLVDTMATVRSSATKQTAPSRSVEEPSGTSHRGATSNGTD